MPQVAFHIETRQAGAKIFEHRLGEYLVNVPEEILRLPNESYRVQIGGRPFDPSMTLVP